MLHSVILTDLVIGRWELQLERIFLIIQQSLSTETVRYVPVAPLFLALVSAFGTEQSVLSAWATHTLGVACIAYRLRKLESSC